MPPVNAKFSAFRSFITMMEYLNEPWGIKDRDSRHIYMNKTAGYADAAEVY